MNEQIVKNYLEQFFSGSPDFEVIRSLLADGFRFRGPLIQADSADQYIEQIRGVAGGGLSMKDAETLAAGEAVAVIYSMLSPFGEVRTVEWFQLADGKIQSIELLNDPRIFVEAFQGQVG